MGVFTDFFVNGFSEAEEELYSEGELYEVRSDLEDKDNAEMKKRKVKEFLRTITVSRQDLFDNFREVPCFALELHANKSESKTGPIKAGYGTYIFIPEDYINTSVHLIANNWTEPIDVIDEADPVKALAAMYADSISGYSTNENIAVCELDLAKNDYYPIDTWDNKAATDPLDGIFRIFENLKGGEFCGISIVIIPPEDGWDIPARKHLRFLEDPNFVEDPTWLDRVIYLFKGQSQPEDDVDRLAGYQKQPLDGLEKSEFDAINTKINDRSGVFTCTIRVYASNETLCENIISMLERFSNATVPYINRLKGCWRECSLVDLAMRREGSYSFLLSAEEIASLWHVADKLNYDDSKLPHINKPLPKATKPPDDLITIEAGGVGDIRAMFRRLQSN